MSRGYRCISTATLLARNGLRSSPLEVWGAKRLALCRFPGARSLFTSWHIGTSFFKAVCAQDLEGIVAEHKAGLEAQSQGDVREIREPAIRA